MIGNWVYISEHIRVPMQVVSIFDEDLYLDFPGNDGEVWDAKESVIMPIPLTEDIILRLGESDFHDNVYYISIGVHLIRFENKKSSFRIHIHDAANMYERAEKVIRYVHELQNICRIYDIKLKVELP